LPEYERDSQQSGPAATKATARLPGLNIEIVHRRSPSGDAEQISIHLQAMPSFEAFGRFLEDANPFLFLGAGEPAGLASLARSRVHRAAAV
jgi:hypothetical protein